MSYESSESCALDKMKKVTVCNSYRRMNRTTMQSVKNLILTDFALKNRGFG